MARPYDDLGSLIRDLDQEGFSENLFGEGFDDEDLALLGQIDPDRPIARKLPTARKPAHKARRKAVKKLRAE